MKRVVTAVAVAIAMVLQFGAVNGLAAAPARAAAAPDYPCLVRALYRDAYGPDRVLSPKDLADYTASLRNGRSLKDIAREIVHSEESVQLAITNAYAEILQRKADPVGRATYYAALTDRTGNDHWSRTWLRVQLASSVEFRSRYTKTQWVEQLYRLFLGRTADPAGRDYWVGQIPVKGYEGVARGIADSNEALALIVKQHYQTLLGRTPSNDEMAPWVRGMADPPSDLGKNEELMAYARDAGGGVLALWLSRIALSALSLGDVARSLGGTKEALALAEVLIRLAQHPLHDMDLTVAFLSEPEYFTRNTTDPTAPTTTVTLAGTVGSNGWYRSMIVAWLSASDATSVGCSSGVRQIQFSVNAGPWRSFALAGPVALGSEGVSTIAYRAVDKAGNTEPTVTRQFKIDKTAPTITGAATTPANAAGWYRQNVTVAFTASDAVSGLASVTPNQVVAAQGAGQSVVGTAVDQAGNTAGFTVGGINIDKTAPVVQITSPKAGTYPNTATPVAAWTATDALSGLEGSHADLGSMALTAGQPIDLLLVPAGSRRVTVAAGDRAGNTSQQSVAIAVTSDARGVYEAAKHMCRIGTLTGHACQVLRHRAWLAAKAADAGQTAQADRALRRVILAAQREPGVPADAAAVLIADARYARAHLQ